MIYKYYGVNYTANYGLIYQWTTPVLVFVDAQSVKNALNVISVTRSVFALKSNITSASLFRENSSIVPFPNRCFSLSLVGKHSAVSQIRFRPRTIYFSLFLINGSGMVSGTRYKFRCLSHLHLYQTRHFKQVSTCFLEKLELKNNLNVALVE